MTSAILFPGIPGGPELLVILLIAVLLFGANKIPKLARSTGEAMGEFQQGRSHSRHASPVRRTHPTGMAGVTVSKNGSRRLHRWSAVTVSHGWRTDFHQVWTLLVQVCHSPYGDSGNGDADSADRTVISVRQSGHR